MLLEKKLDLVLDSESYHADISHVRLFPNTLLYAVPKALLLDPSLLKKAAFVGDTLIKAQPSDRLLFYTFDHEMPRRWISVAYKTDEYLSKGSRIFIETSRSVYREDRE